MVTNPYPDMFALGSEIFFVPTNLTYYRGIFGGTPIPTRNSHNYEVPVLLNIRGTATTTIHTHTHTLQLYLKSNF
jgi:hypothetical protein